MALMRFFESPVPVCLFLFILMAGLSACNGDTSGSGKSVKEIQTGGKISSIIRNPVSADGSIDTVNVARMTFENPSFDYGDVKAGEIVTHVFRFVNNGKAPLVINNAHSTCGCTVPTWPKDPVAPGASGEINVEFNTSNKSGFQEKPIIISANTFPATTKVYLRGYVNETKN
ncbi:MAG: DUF1573 domain-containing protein [Saprospiraceae bacterium]|nr:MAG: DUF1573 domain-containing protein [Saprospiraceae bacterium]